MMETFDHVISDIKALYETLVSTTPCKIENLPRQMPKAGIYILGENEHVLYVGRANNLRQRLQHHTRNSHNQATFAFLLARRETGRTKATYQKKGSRSDLLNDPIFRAAFDTARARIRKMDIRYVGVEDPVRQALLEIYAAFQTKAPYNDFDNH